MSTAAPLPRLCSGAVASSHLPRGLALALAALACAGWAPEEDAPTPPDSSSPTGGQQQPAQADPFEDPAPRDPDDTPFMPAPNNQLGQWSVGRERPLTRGFDDDHWVQLGVVPTYAAFHLPFTGRGEGPFRGGGLSLELDFRVVRWLFLRAFVSHTVHPVFAESSYDEESDTTTQLARGGLIQATNTGASAVYALDLGRFVPRVDVGAGLLFVRSPEGPLDGQWGGQCGESDACDPGLSCASDGVCRPTPVLEGHIGVAVDVLLGSHWSVGIGVRYYALFSALSELPVYLTGSVRLGARF
ncbi:hypothetical protein G6O69_27045 [Pseudenhygromyxa sp. WMMC2535]|uniref:hypothetical protein n=1 Tax=Pseudenhygromyxa sp. WMMC2535 TaxID=2712867 RepID=UPI001595C535|nr:hypothetical protein [Pseudenhygromyxa sp. WMMC2535]NVB41525.1 hypothetical protein [Pseudenhygromyxa sp. WMMC2535]